MRSASAVDRGSRPPASKPELNVHGEVRMVLSLPSTTNLPLALAGGEMARSVLWVPELTDIQLRPSLEVRILPESPTAMYPNPDR